MKVKFRTTLGSRDAAECHRLFSDAINHADCMIGAEVDVNEKSAAWLAARGLIEEIELPKKEKPKPELKAVPEEPVISKASEPAIKK